MKLRSLETRKILAVALTAVAGCTPAASPAPTPEIALVRAPDAPASAPTEPRQAPSAPIAAAAPAPPKLDDPALIALRNQLLPLDRVQALAQRARFRPLCDADGYPVVGNVYRKTAHADYEPSAFCEEVRKPPPQ